MNYHRLRILAAVIIWAICLPLLISVPRSDTDAFMGFAVTDPPFTSLTYGIQAFLWWDHGFAGRDMDWIKLMAFSHVKQTFAWDDIQPQRDEWSIDRADALLTELERRDLKVIARLSDAPAWTHPEIGARGSSFIDAPPDDVADFARFCGVLADRYKGRIAAYQVWNEPNLSREWGNRPPDAAGYVGLLKACSDAIRATDPAAIIISAGLAPTGTYDDSAHPDDVYLQAMYDANFQQYVDAVGLHAPGYSAPEVPPEDGAGGHRILSPSATSRTCAGSWSPTAMPRIRSRCSKSAGRLTRKTRITRGLRSMSRRKRAISSPPMSTLPKTGVRGSA